MTKKEFIIKIDAIIWAENPEQQRKLINELYKNTAAKNCNLQNVSVAKRKVCAIDRETLMCGIWLRSGHTCELCEYFKAQT